MSKDGDGYRVKHGMTRQIRYDENGDSLVIPCHDTESTSTQWKRGQAELKW